jgi:hypothetical protein
MCKVQPRGSKNCCPTESFVQESASYALWYSIVRWNQSERDWELNHFIHDYVSGYISDDNYLINSIEILNENM